MCAAYNPRPEWAHVSACDDSLCVNLPRSRSFPLLSWCPLISWCCRGFQNSAGGGGISFHCHDNDSDTLAPSLTQTSYCMETGMQFLLAAASDNPVWEWKVPKWLAIQAKLKGQRPIKGGTLEQHHPRDPRLALKTHIRHHQDPSCTPITHPNWAVQSRISYVSDLGWSWEYKHPTVRDDTLSNRSHRG